MKHCSRNRLSILLKHMSMWLEFPRESRSIIGEEVAQAFFKLGFDQALQREGINFKRTDDVDRDMRTRAQKLFRWLGHYEDIAPDTEKLFYIEVAIVAAMPEPIRLSYLNEVFAVTGVFIGIFQDPSKELNHSQIAAALMKENTEAQLSVLGLSNEPSEEEVTNTYRELQESAGTTIAALNLLERHYPKLRSYPKVKSRLTPCFSRTGEAADQDAHGSRTRRSL
ncbi:hypothetical protein [Algicola sagamiensis]|uniref:hypothetical protein n=1 Tax=Algicola sagamiensis TaxID=163869 RepID=UPI0003803848|nr:hypothetical protein [Algicola sagamiensis]